MMQPVQFDPAHAVVWDNRPCPQRIGLALGGGASRGLAHIGVLEVLEENGVPVDCIAGASAGALVGGLYAAGITATRLRQLGYGLKWRDISKFTLPAINLASLNWGSLNPAIEFPLGLLDLDPLADWIDQVLGMSIRFDQLNIPFAAVATDITTSEMVVMNKGEIAKAIRASCSVPGVFTPCRRNGRLLVDGGAVNNLPVSVVRQMGADYVISVDLIGTEGIVQREPQNLIELSMTALYALIRASQSEAPMANRNIAPAIAHISLADMGSREELLAAGRAAAEAMIPEILSDLGRRSDPTVLPD